MANILIVDDQQSVLLTLEALLKSENHLVTACTNAIDAIDRLSREPYDLVISDIVMSVGGNGLALLRTIRNEPKLARTPVILLTGKREKADIEKGIQSGADDYVIKPIDPTLLIAKIRLILTKSEQSGPKFAEARVQAKAEIEARTEILAISELGCTLQSNICASIGALIKVHSDLFKEIGFESANLRIVSVEKVEGVEGAHKMVGNFVGLAEKELTPLRLWVRGRARI